MLLTAFLRYIGIHIKQKGQTRPALLSVIHTIYSNANVQERSLLAADENSSIWNNEIFVVIRSSTVYRIRFLIVFDS